ncbi:MAG: YbaN family protein [Pseudomonadaceae bacterium]
MIWFWRSLASLCVTLGAIGVVVPGLPTTPFLLVAAWASARGWPELEARLLLHPHYGPLIRDWREHRAVPRRAKWAASALMLSSILMIWLLPSPLWLRWSLPLFLCCVAGWLWTRPEPQPGAKS